MSRAVAARPVGTLRTRRRFGSPISNPRCFAVCSSMSVHMSVSTMPGARAFTVTPVLASDAAIDRVRDMTAALLAA